MDKSAITTVISVTHPKANNLHIPCHENLQLFHFFKPIYTMAQKLINQRIKCILKMCHKCDTNKSFFNLVNIALFIGKQNLCLQQIATCRSCYTKPIIRLNPYKILKSSTLCMFAVNHFFLFQLNAHNMLNIYIIYIFNVSCVFSCNKKSYSLFNYIKENRISHHCSFKMIVRFCTFQ